MQPRTLTTLGQLRPGDVWCTESSDNQFIKMPGKPYTDENRNKYECFAVAVDKEWHDLKRFKGKKPVIYLYTDQYLLTSKIKKHGNHVLHPASKTEQRQSA